MNQKIFAYLEIGADGEHCVEIADKEALREMKRAGVNQLHELKLQTKHQPFTAKRYDRDEVAGHSDVEIPVPGLLHHDHGPNLAEALARLAYRIARFHNLDAPSLKNNPFSQIKSEQCSRDGKDPA